MILKQHDLVYIPQRAIIGQALADYLVDHQIPDDWELNDNLLGEDMFLIVILTPCEM